MELSILNKRTIIINLFHNDIMSKEKVLESTMQVVTFTITEKSSKKGNYAVPIEQVKEIKIVEAITKIPKSKSHVKGVMNLRGKIIPIIDVNKKIGLSDSNTSDNAKQRILVADVNDTLTGLLVDEVNEVLRIPIKDIEDSPQGAIEENYIKGIAKVDEKLIVLLDVSKFLNDSKESIKDETSILNSESNEVETEIITDSKDDGILPEIEAIINQEHN